LPLKQNDLDSFPLSQASHIGNCGHLPMFLGFT